MAILYERIGDGRWMGRTVEDEIGIFKDVNADFIFRAFWRWSPCPEKCMDLPAEKRGRCTLHGYSYRHLEETISKIKDENAKCDHLRGDTGTDNPEEDGLEPQD
ncbi:hypothetical protein CW705_05060 [Candidatus Bathyarchaeota archaeon]|nr:MAG: hypothetical protein CW705_05060 [Candidatus Bathyarchaeota archaeon]